MLKKSRIVFPNIAVVCLCGLLLVLAAVFSGLQTGSLRSNEVAYVAVPQAVLRDRVAALYNKVGTVTNGQKLEILEHQKRFVKVRTAGNAGRLGRADGIWPARTSYDGFEKLAKENGPGSGPGKRRNPSGTEHAPDSGTRLGKALSNAGGR